MLKSLCQIVIIVETEKHISSFDKCITRKLSNVIKFKMLSNRIQFGLVCMLKVQ